MRGSSSGMTILAYFTSSTRCTLNLKHFKRLDAISDCLHASLWYLQRNRRKERKIQLEKPPLAFCGTSPSSPVVTGDWRVLLGRAKRAVPSDDSRPSDRSADAGLAPAGERATRGNVCFHWAGRRNRFGVPRRNLLCLKSLRII